MHASLQTFLDATSTFEFNEFGSLSLDSAEWAGRDMAVVVTLREQDQPDRSWRLSCAAVRNSRLQGVRELNHVMLLSVHPLLLPHVSPVVELHFRGRPADLLSTIGELVEAHRRIVGSWFDWTRFLNVHVLSDGGPRRLLEGGFGSFADGPKPLIEAYGRVLEGRGVTVSFLPERRPAWWDGTRWVDETVPLYALLLGESYVVSPGVTAEELRASEIDTV